MSRAVFLHMSERAIILHCEAEKIGISALSKLPSGGMRLVCMSVEGAAEIRHKLKARLMKADAPPEHRGPGGDFVARA